jgi:hypothetical protein
MGGGLGSIRSIFQTQASKQGKASKQTNTQNKTKQTSKQTKQTKKQTEGIHIQRHRN